MLTVISVIHVALCFFLIIVILLQAGKGADIGAAFGAGSSQTLFGPRGAATLLNKMTAVVAIAFLGTTLGIVLLTGGPKGGSVLEKVPAPVAPETETVPTGP